MVEGDEAGELREWEVVLAGSALAWSNVWRIGHEFMICESDEYMGGRLNATKNDSMHLPSLEISNLVIQPLLESIDTGLSNPFFLECKMQQVCYGRHFWLISVKQRQNVP